MGITIDSSGVKTCAVIEGELSIMTVAQEQDSLLGLLNYPSVVVSLEAITLLDGCGAQLLSLLQQEATSLGKSMTYVLDPDSLAAETFQAMGLWAHLTIEGCHGHQ
ncbi:MAG: STAS domain-containing protein [Plesiomonas shigelloides]